MILIPSQRFLYLRVPRTGSTSTSHHLVELLSNKFKDVFHTGIKYNNISSGNLHLDVHANAQDLIKNGTISTLNMFEIYGVIRNPIDRFKSFVSLAIKSHNDINHIDCEQFLNNSFESILHSLKPQSDWLLYNNKNISKIFSFENIPMMIQDIFFYLKLDHHPLKYRHRSEDSIKYPVVLNQQQINKIKNTFQEDFKIYDKYCS